MKSFLQRKANGIMVRLFGSIPFKKQFKYKQKEIDFRGMIHRQVDSISNDTRTFKNYL